MSKRETRRFKQAYPTIMSLILQEKKIGRFELQKKIVPKGTVLKMYNHVEGSHYHYRFPTEYKTVMLKEDGETWMSDTPYEQDGIRPALTKAKGDCLVCGLGIGLFPTFLSLFRRDVITSMDIVELNQEVIDLVYPQLKLSFPNNIIHGDAWKYLATTEKRYDFIHIDIWGDYCTTITEIQRALELSQNILKPNGITRVWLMELYNNIKDRLPKTPMHSTGIGYYDPCLICAKTLRNDYAGLCMDCADGIGLSEYFTAPIMKLVEEARKRQ